MNPYDSLVFLEPSMPEMVADPPASTCYHLFPRADSRNLNNLILISFCLARATRARSRRGALATRAAGRPGSPIRGAARDRHVGLRGWQESPATNARRFPGEKRLSGKSTIAGSALCVLQGGRGACPRAARSADPGAVSSG